MPLADILNIAKKKKWDMEKLANDLDADADNLMSRSLPVVNAQLLKTRKMNCYYLKKDEKVIE